MKLTAQEKRVQQHEKNLEMWSKWAKVLGRNIDEKKNIYDMGMEVMKHRTELLLEGTRGFGMVDKAELQAAYVVKDVEKLSDLLSELFLEPIGCKEVSFMLGELEKKNMSIMDLYKKHQMNPCHRMLRFVL